MRMRFGNINPSHINIPGMATIFVGSYVGFGEVHVRGLLE